MRIYKVAVNEVGDDMIVDTYWGTADNGEHAAQLAISMARVDRDKAIDEAAETTDMTPDELSEAKRGELYASEIRYFGDVEFSAITPTRWFTRDESGDYTDIVQVWPHKAHPTCKQGTFCGRQAATSRVCVDDFTARTGMTLAPGEVKKYQLVEK